MMVDNRRIYVIMIKTIYSLISHSLSHSNYLLSYSLFSVMSGSRQSKVQTDWSVDFFLTVGSSAADRG